MFALSLRAGLLAAAVAAGGLPAIAADLDYGTVPPPDRFSSAYEDPRYRDLYGPEPPPPSRAYSWEPPPAPRYVERPYYAEPPRYAEPPPHPVPPGYVYRDRFTERFVEHAPGGDWRHRDGCLPRQEIRRRLIDDGWRDFHDIEIGRNSVRVQARRPNGDLFALKVDRCNGEILRADLVERYGRPYAWQGEGRRFERPYY